MRKPMVNLAKAEGGGGDDIPALVDMVWDAFRGPGESLFPHTARGRAWLERSFEGFLGRPSFYRPESRIAVVRSPNGRPVAFLLAHIVRPGQNAGGKSWKTRWERCGDGDGDGDGDDKGDAGVSEERLAAFFEPMARAHQLVLKGKEGHVFIELLITKPSHRLRGHASALVGWAARLADELGYPCYLDGGGGGGRGSRICERAGFRAQDVEFRYGGPPPCVPMLRPGRE
ncbi:hypothetical protein F5X99DRAFT_405332 [Biscogniauxia marginata]|nr:hypothetical protein F5X99DRAFT_405332 [Biscogniauxia marginata]